MLRHRNTLTPLLHTHRLRDDGGRPRDSIVPTIAIRLRLLEAPCAICNGARFVLDDKAYGHRSEDGVEHNGPYGGDEGFFGQIRRVVQTNLYNEQTDLTTRYHGGTEEHGGPECGGEALADRHTRWSAENGGERYDKADHDFRYQHKQCIHEPLPERLSGPKIDEGDSKANRCEEERLQEVLDSVEEVFLKRMHEGRADIRLTRIIVLGSFSNRPRFRFLCVFARRRVEGTCRVLGREVGEECAGHEGPVENRGTAEACDAEESTQHKDHDDDVDDVAFACLGEAWLDELSVYRCECPFV